MRAQRLLNTINLICLLIWAFTICACQRPEKHRRSWLLHTASTASAIIITGFKAVPFSSGPSGKCGFRKARLSILSVLGQRELDPKLGRQPANGSP